MTSATLQQSVNPKTGMTDPEMKKFVRDHFEEFVNRKNLDIGNANFAPEFIDHGADVPPGLPPGPAGAMQYVGGAYKKFPDIHIEILDVIARMTRSSFAITARAPKRPPVRNTSSPAS
jgi:hypothetical protein